MKKTIHRVLKMLFITIIASSIIFSCAKEGETIGIIKVVYSNGNPMINAKVVLNQTNGAPGTTSIDNLRKESQTDNNGRAQFTYAHEAILDVTVTKNSGNDTYIGNNVIRLVKGETTTLEVEAVIQ